MHVNYLVLEEKKWDWAEMNTQRVVSGGWRTQPNPALLPAFPPPVTVTDRVLEEMPCVFKPAPEMLLGTAAVLSTAVAGLLTHFLEMPRRKYGNNIYHTTWKPAYLGALTTSEDNYGMARANAKILHRERLNFETFLSS